VNLREWHGPRFEPAVKNFRDSSQHTLALFGWNGDVIDEFSVKISDFTAPRELLELLD